MMMKETDAWKWMLVGFFGCVLIVWIMSAVLKPRDVNVDIARAAERATRAAEAMRRDMEARRSMSSGIRIMGLVVGVTVPMIVAYLIYRHREGREPGVHEVLQVMKRAKLIERARGKELAQVERRGLRQIRE